MSWIADIKWNEKGLIPAISQDVNSGEVLMVAWMDHTALAETVETGKAVYWSRSRKKIWRKGEESGHQQLVKEIRLDCDSDVLLLKIEQQGGIACHTVRRICFFKVLDGEEWVEKDPVLKDPKEIYKS
jgi:phosphoribosyl-AMP cyclohydrolase